MIMRLASVCPAPAGMILIKGQSKKSGKCLPRTRGDDPAQGSGSRMWYEFAPHPRG